MRYYINMIVMRQTEIANKIKFHTFLKITPYASNGKLEAGFDRF